MQHDRRSLGRFLLATTALTGALGATMAAPSVARAQSLPTGYSTAAGSVGFARASGTLTINQSSQNAIVNYQSFSIGQKNTVNIVQPNASSALLNRVTGSTPSTIAGQLNANGQVYLINPNGIAITKTGVVKVGGGFVASSLGMSDEEWKHGRKKFSGDGASAAVTNAGTISIGRGGYAALIGGTVTNSGLISVPMGKVGLGSGEAATLDVSGDGFLQVAVPTGTSTGAALIQQSGTIRTVGGTVVIDAATARAAARNAVNISGGIDAHSISGHDGSIVIGGGEGGAVEVTGPLSVASRHATGGSITLTGQQIAFQRARLDASGATGGGTIRIGGDPHGAGQLQNADSVTTDNDTTIKADAIGSGNGGSVLFWSDATASFSGVISADGGLNSGNGGSIVINAPSTVNQGLIAADGQTGNGGSISINAQRVYIDTANSILSAQSYGAGEGGQIAVLGMPASAGSSIFISGTHSVRSAQGAGGSIVLTANAVRVVDAQLDASGASEGGTIIVGGDGQGLIPAAATTLVTAGTMLDVDARNTGNGGKVAVWSNSSTIFAGSISGRGGPQAGDGGRAEVSVASGGQLNFAGTADLSAAAGTKGTLLLDPQNIVIDNTIGGVAQYQLIDPDPTPGGTFGATTVTLTNGNIVVANPTDGFGGTNAGAVYQFNGTTGQLLSMVTGSHAGDDVGGGGIPTVNFGANYVILSQSWNGGFGAATFGTGANGVSGGVVSAANSLVGSAAGDFTNSSIQQLNSGNYVVMTPQWSNGIGAATWGSGTTGVAGPISSTISLTGSTPGDFTNSSLQQLNNANYVVMTPQWSNGIGAATWGSGTAGVAGPISSTISLTGSTPGDFENYSLQQLNNGNYVVLTPQWSNGIGAATWGSGTAGVAGPISSTISVTGSTPGDQVGSGTFLELVGSGYDNYVVTSPNWSNGSIASAGAVTLVSGADGTFVNGGGVGSVAASNSLVGSTPFDQIGSGGVLFVGSANYLVLSPNWTNPATNAGNAGAVTWASGSAGVVGPIYNGSTYGNSLVGSNADDAVGSGGILGLPNGNYLVLSPQWGGSLGAVSWGSANAALPGAVVSGSNSLVGATTGDQIGSGGVNALGNGDYVVLSPNWHDANANPVGAATWGNGNTGTSGVVGTTNSLYGGTAGDFTGASVVPLSTNNYVVDTPNWNITRPRVTDAGAVTFGDDSSGGIVGQISSAISLIGSGTGDQVGGGGVILLATNGNYVVSSPNWGSGGTAGNGIGAATWGSGTTGISGVVGASNSLTGNGQGDQVASGGIVPLPNGNYVVVSPAASSLNGRNGGAVTWGNGASGTIGAISTANSLYGGPSDQIGSSGVATLSNGNYVVLSPTYADGTGAATWGDGATGTVGAVSGANSIVGANSDDAVGSGGLVGNLGSNPANGNYVVISPSFGGGLGAVTFASGTGPTAETVSAANSLVGAAAGDNIGSGGVTTLFNGNYLVLSPSFGSGNGGLGAVTFGNGDTGVVGAVSSANSLVGAAAGDNIGSGGVTTLFNGNYLVLSPSFGSGGVPSQGLGAVTFGNAATGVVGAVSSADSLVGSAQGDEVGSGGIVDLSYLTGNSNRALNQFYLVLSPNWNGSAGAISLGSAIKGVSGAVSADNSLLGNSPGAALGFQYYDPINQVIIGRAANGVGPATGNPATSNEAEIGGQLQLGLFDPNQLTFTRAQDQTVTISATTLAQALTTASVDLQASNDITVNSPLTVSSGGQGLTLQAGESIFLNAGLTLNGVFTATANDPTAIAPERGGSAGSIVMGVGSFVDTSAANGSISLNIGSGISPGAITVTSLKAGSGSIEIAGSTGGAITIGSLSTTGSITISGGSSVSASGAIGAATPTSATNIRVTSPGDIKLNEVTGYTIFAQSDAGVTLDAALTSTANQAGAITLVDGNAFTNNGGSITAENGGSWLVYSQNPADDTTTGLAYSFKQYNAPYSTAPSAGGNGFLYALAPVASLTGVTKTYDGTTTATLSAGSYTVGGAASGDTVSLTASSGSFGSANAGSNLPVSFSNLNASVSSTDGLGNPIPVYGYAVATPGNVGTITAAPLTISAVTNAKTYDGTTSAAATPTVTGTVYSADPLTSLSESYASPNAGTGLTLNPSASFANAGNYSVTYVASSAGVINPAALTVTAQPNTKTYDGTTSAAATPTVTGTVYSADPLTSLSESYASPNAGTGLTLNPSASFANAGNYSVTYVASSAGVINPAALTVTAQPSTKTYDGTTSAAATPTVTGTVYSADPLTSLSESYASPNAGTGLTLNPSASFANAGNYSVTYVASSAGVINPAALTVTAQPNTKTYDGTTSAAATPTVTGTVYSADPLTSLSESYVSPNAGTGLTLNPSASFANAGNYSVTYVASSAGVINPAALTVTAQPNTKTYDGTTSAAATPTVTGTVYSADPLTSLSESYASPNAGTGLTLNPSASFANAGNYSVTYVASSAGVINPAALTVTAQPNTKTYDGTTSAAATPTVTGTVYSADPLTSLSESYASPNAGTGLTLNPSASFANAGNYSVTYVASSAGVINPAALTVTAQPSTKTYDGTTSAAATPTVTGTVYSADPLTSLSESYASPNAGTGLTLNPSASFANAGNYSVTYVASSAGVINPAALTVTAQPNTKTYDGTTSAAATPTVTGTVYSADPLTSLSESYVSPNAGTGLTLNPSASFANAGNYSVTYVASSAGVINPAALTVTAQPNTKTYDGTTSAAATPTVTGTVYSADPLTSLSESYASPNAGTGLTLNPSASFANAGNYSVTYVASSAGVINPAALTVTAQPNTKTYDGTTSAAATPTVTGTVYSADPLTSLSESYASPNAGTGLTLNPSASFANAGNYSVTYVASSAGVINPAALTVTAQPNTKTYDGTTSAAATPTVTGTVYSADPLTSLSESYVSPNVGTGLTLNPSAIFANAGNYSVTYVASSAGVITPRPLTIAADDAARLLGAANPPLTYTIGGLGLVNGDTLNGALTTAATAASLPGAYAIVQGTLSATSNYAVSFVPGVLFVSVVTPTQDLASTVDRVLTEVLGHPIDALPSVFLPIEGGNSTAARILLGLGDPRFDQIVVCTGGVGASPACVVVPPGQQQTSFPEVATNEANPSVADHPNRQPNDTGCKSGAIPGSGFTQLAASPTWRNIEREIASVAALQKSISAADLDEARQQLKLGVPGAEDATALEQRIGSTVIVKNQVDELTGAAAKSISVGDNVFLDETVRTGQDSTGKFVLSDATNLAMGPKSTVKLDRFVFSGGGESSYSKAVLNLTKGTFRFITGSSPKTAYEIDTPVASIGVRGTIVDIKVDKGVTTVALQEGNAIVCLRHSSQCITLTPGQTVSVTATKVARSVSAWTFASTCVGNSALCGQTTVAQAAAVQQQVAQGSFNPCPP